MEIKKGLAPVTNVETKDQEPDIIEENLSLAVTRRASIARILIKHSLTWARYSLERLPIKMTLSNLGILAVLLAIVLPRTVTYILLYPIFRLVFGNLYPAYASYKAVRTKNVKEYVKWMMYWIVFALFTCAETFTDVFFSFWFPFYYEIKTILVVWLLSPATKGSSILYRRFVHPALIRREAEIDEALARATEQGYTAVLHLGSKGVNYATTVLMQTAIKHFLNSVPTTLSELPASQSDSAISSLVNPRAALTRNSPTTKDCQDGVATTQQPSTSMRSTDSEELILIGLDPDLHDLTTDEEMDHEPEESEPPIFKTPPKKSEKTRKPKKERAEATRRQRTRACKESLKNYDTDFSDGLAVD